MIIRYNQKLEPLRRIFDSDILFNRPDSNEIIRFFYKLQDSVSKTVAKFTENPKSDWNRKVNQNGVNRWVPDLKPILQPNIKLWKIANPSWFRLSVLELKLIFVGHINHCKECTRGYNFLSSSEYGRCSQVTHMHAACSMPFRFWSTRISLRN